MNWISKTAYTAAMTLGGGVSDAFSSQALQDSIW